MKDDGEGILLYLKEKTLLPGPPLRNMTQFKTKVPEWRCFVMYTGALRIPATLADQTS